MVAGTDFIIQLLRQYLCALEREHIPVLKAYLFGSYAQGTPKEESDIDVAIISTAFVGDRYEDRRRIVPLRRKIDGRIEPIPFRPEDFERGGILADTIKTTGVVIQ